MFNKIMIANRGEIACRIARTCKRMGIGTVGVYSEADKFGQHAILMEQSFLVGPPPAAESYLKFKHLIEVATYAKCEAVHPG